MIGNQFAVNALSSDTVIYLSQDECEKVQKSPIEGELYINAGRKKIIKVCLEVVEKQQNILNSNGYSFGYEEQENSIKIFTFPNIIETLLSDFQYESRWSHGDGSKLCLQNINGLSEVQQQEKIEDFMFNKFQLLKENMDGKDNPEKFKNLLLSGILTEAESLYLKELMG